ncbi:MAG: hypothetical protein ABIB47_03325 [Candidatus Woesearchaeota archaeon]
MRYSIKIIFFVLILLLGTTSVLAKAVYPAPTTIAFPEEFELFLYTDVAVTDIAISPEEPELGDEVNALITIQNLGDVATDVTIGASFTGPGFGGGGETCPYCIPLEPGEIYITPLSFVASQEGEYEISANVNSQILDINPNNNRLVLIFVVE